MKKLLFILPLILLLFFNCGKKQNKEQSFNDSDSINIIDNKETELVPFNTKTIMVTSPSKNIDFSITFDEAIETETDVANRINQEIFNAISTNYLLEEGDECNKYAKKMNSLYAKYNNLKMVAEQNAKDFCKSAIKIHKEILEEQDDEYNNEGIETTESEEQQFYSSYGLKIIKDEVADKYITYDFDNFYYFEGAAHGLAVHYKQTFDRNTGKLLTIWDIIKSSSKKELEQIIKKELKSQYYKDITPGWAEPETMFAFDIPTQNPALTSKGLFISYQQYEIDCYAAGMPECVIPYAKLESILTDYAIKLICVN